MSAAKIPLIWIATSFAAIVGTVLAAAVFGFFYAYASSVMFGLDSLDSRNAIVAMQGINATVRNRIFAPAFFGPSPVLILAAILAYFALARQAALAFAAAATVYFLLSFLPTLLVNVPMNDALARVSTETGDLGAVWSAYSTRWQWWNGARTITSGVSVVLALLGLLFLGTKRAIASPIASNGILKS